MNQRPLLFQMQVAILTALIIFTSASLAEEFDIPDDDPNAMKLRALWEQDVGKFRSARDYEEDRLNDRIDIAKKRIGLELRKNQLQIERDNEDRHRELQALLDKKYDFISKLKNSPKDSHSIGIRKLSKDEKTTLNTILNKTYQLGSESEEGSDNQDILEESEEPPAWKLDFLSIIMDSPETRKSSGIQKLSKAEQEAMNIYFNEVYQLGAERQKNLNNREFRGRASEDARMAAKNPVYITTINKDRNEILKLVNGAVIEITRKDLGYGRFRRNANKQDAVLFKDGKSWRIWIEARKSYNCEIIRPPDKKPSGTGDVISIFEVKGNGKILTTVDGSLYEVGDLHAMQTGLWFGPFKALLIDSNKLLKLNDGGGIIRVTRL